MKSRLWSILGVSLFLLFCCNCMFVWNNNYGCIIFQLVLFDTEFYVRSYMSPLACAVTCGLFRVLEQCGAVCMVKYILCLGYWRGKGGSGCCYRLMEGIGGSRCFYRLTEGERGGSRCYLFKEFWYTLSKIVLDLFICNCLLLIKIYHTSQDYSWTSHS
jgi:hypothetical protein